MLEKGSLPPGLSVLGLGVDTVEVDRIRDALEARSGARFERRVFTAAEVVYCRSKADPYPHFAARFAAKEAVMKALGTGWTAQVNWTGIEVVHGERGKPLLRLNDQTAEFARGLGLADSHLSLSHDRVRAVAVALLLRA
ncbi:holo-ACP synthase [bacterium]|nr:holo-ACP synthase [bacterium]